MELLTKQFEQHGFIYASPQLQDLVRIITSLAKKGITGICITKVVSKGLEKLIDEPIQPVYVLKLSFSDDLPEEVKEQLVNKKKNQEVTAEKYGFSEEVFFKIDTNKKRKKK